MKDINKIKKDKYLRRRRRTRAKIRGTAQRPRVSVFRSLRYISAQVIDDEQGRTILAMTEPKIVAKGTKTERALTLGVTLGQKLVEQDITTIVFDRGAYKYHGRVKAVAEGLRQSGIKF